MSERAWSCLNCTVGGGCANFKADGGLRIGYQGSISPPGLETITRAFLGDIQSNSDGGRGIVRLQ